VQNLEFFNVKTLWGVK